MGRCGSRGLRTGRFGFFAPLLLLFQSLLLLLEANFLFERAFQLIGGALEFGEAFAQRPAELRQLPWTKNDERDHENDDQLRHANRTKHETLLTVGKPARVHSHYTQKSL